MDIQIIFCVIIFKIYHLNFKNFIYEILIFDDFNIKINMIIII